MRLRIVNDLHVGATRKAGVTPASQESLRTWMLSEVRALCLAHAAGPLLALGDIFDDFSVSNRDLSAALDVFCAWLDSTDHQLILASGNHDWSPRGSAQSSFHLLTDILSRLYPGRVVVVTDGPIEVLPGIHCVPHAPNQDIFQSWLQDLMVVRGGAILLHANCMNPFSEGSLHSLNVDETTLKNLSKDNLVVFAHEHQMREPMRNVVVIGNSVPSSVSDVLGCKSKFCLELNLG